MSPWLYGVGGAALAGAFAGWTVRDWKADSELLAANEAVQAAYVAKAEAESAAAIRYEALAQQIRASERSDRLEIREIYRDVEVPADCAVPDAGVSVLDNAIQRANAAATGQSLDPVPDTTEPADPID